MDEQATTLLTEFAFHSTCKGCKDVQLAQSSRSSAIWLDGSETKPAMKETNGNFNLSFISFRLCGFFECITRQIKSFPTNRPWAEKQLKRKWKPRLRLSQIIMELQSSVCQQQRHFVVRCLNLAPFAVEAICTMHAWIFRHHHVLLFFIVLNLIMFSHNRCRQQARETEEEEKFNVNLIE